MKTWKWMGALAAGVAGLGLAAWLVAPGLLATLAPLGERAETRAQAGVPVVMHTDGGLLEVATVTAYERFAHETVRTLFGHPLPAWLFGARTHLQLKTVYRYHIEMARRWPLEREGELWIVRAPDVRPTLPVAFDTRDLEHYTERGWARLDRLEDTVTLLRQLSPELERRAAQPAYRQLARDAGRRTIARFVRNWLLAAQPDAADARIVVLFPGEELGQQP